MVVLAVESASLGRLSSSSASSEASSSADWPETVRVAVRVRPPLAREVSTEELTVRAPGEVTAWPDDGLGPGPRYSFTFDAAFSPSEGQAAVYDAVARPAVSSTLAGFNASIIAYGHTGAGKTHTMEGAPDGAQRGIIPRAVADIFEHVERSARPGARRFLVRASYLQIYNEALSDLLKPGRNGLVIREDRKKGLRAEGLSEWVVRSPAEVDGLLRRGAETRATAATAANDASSRSHAVFCLTFEQSEASGGGEACPRGSVFRSSKLNLVDLAGSERLRVSGASGQRLEECKYINGSLAALGNVVAALTSGTARHVPYRDSKLTRLLADSLGGNCKTTMIACVAAASMAETVSTLKFASRARHVHNSARINEQIDQRTKLQSLEVELTRLRAVLVEREQSVGDSRRSVQAEAICAAPGRVVEGS